jgi:D-sedoheptulose 7-phosphate isomerase
MRDQLERYWKDLAAMARKMPMGALAEVANVLLDCYQRNGTVFVLGNGGSAATASHFACDLGKGTRNPGAPPFRVVALTDNAALMTAWANDTSYDRVFAEQLVALVRPGDVVVAISASGESPNVLRAAEAARELGAATVALTGPSVCRLHDLADFIVRAPTGTIEQVEDVHLAIGHSLCLALREQLQAAAEPLTGELSVLKQRRTEPAAVELGR